MVRIIWMILTNLWYLPYAMVRVFRMAKSPESYSLKERYDQVRRVAERAVKTGRVKIVSSGLENLPEKDGYIIYPNHQGMFDIVAIIQLHERPLSVVLKKELANIPALKQVIACIGGLALDRSDARQGLKVILQVAEEVKQGRNYLIFAEGTRNKNGNSLQEFKGGSFKSATKAKCPIVPVAVIDCNKVLDTNSLEKLTAQIHFLKPIPYEEYQGMKTLEIAALVRSRIEAKIAECT